MSTKTQKNDMEKKRKKKLIKGPAKKMKIVIQIFDLKIQKKF